MRQFEMNEWSLERQSAQLIGSGQKKENESEHVNCTCTCDDAWISKRTQHRKNDGQSVRDATKKEKINSERGGEQAKKCLSKEKKYREKNSIRRIVTTL